MNDMSHDEKLKRFHEFFTIEYQVNVNIVAKEPEFITPDHDTFLQEMPWSFKIANEVATLEQSALRPLRMLGDVADELGEFLKAQSRKIDLIMSYILSKEEDGSTRMRTSQLGAGGFTILADNDIWQHGQTLQVKLFLTDEATAIFCYGEIIVEEEKDDKTLYSVVFTQIRDEDREILVRAALHQQSRVLKRRSEKKNQADS